MAERRREGKEVETGEERRRGAGQEEGKSAGGEERSGVEWRNERRTQQNIRSLYPLWQYHHAHAEREVRDEYEVVLVHERLSPRVLAAVLVGRYRAPGAAVVHDWAGDDDRKVQGSSEGTVTSPQERSRLPSRRRKAWRFGLWTTT
eukprot:754925-Hanusia_phi.AAC.3